jgi:hypothetical protein
MDPQINVFISYCHKDQGIKLQLERLLSSRGLNVLSDANNHAGKELHKSISILLNQSHFVVPIITKHWLDSIETRDEFVRAHERRKMIICLYDSGDGIDEKTLPFFVKEDLRIHFTAETVSTQLEQVYTEIKNANFVDFWKNSCYDEIRRVGDLLQNSHNLHHYKSEQFEKKLKKLHSDLSKIVNDDYETNVSYEDNFLRDASPYFKFASKITAVSIVNVSTFWTDRKAQSAAISYLKTQSDPSKDVTRLFVFETRRQVHIYKKILQRNFNYYVQAKVNNHNLLSGVLLCSKKTYQQIITREMQYDSSMGNNIFEQDFGILTYESQLNKHSLEATLNSTNFKVKKIDLEDEMPRQSFVDFMDSIVKYKDDSYIMSQYGIAKLNGNIFEDEAKWNVMVDNLFAGQNTSDIFHVIYFKVKPDMTGQFEEIMGKFISTMEQKKLNGELKVKAISLRKFKKIDNARDHKTNGELRIKNIYNYALNLVFANQEFLEQYYHDAYHSQVREELYVLLNQETKKQFTKLTTRNISEFEKKHLFKQIEALVGPLVLRVDWEQYDTKNSITPFPL